MALNPDSRSLQRSTVDELDGTATIARALARLDMAVERKPGFGCSTAKSTSVLLDGLRCRSNDGDHELETDLPSALGGTDSGPSPSVLLRAALGSCLAMGYRLQAARHGLPIASVQVVVETDSSIAGLLSPSSAAPPGPTQIRYRVDIASPAAPPDVATIVGRGDELSPVLDALSRPMPFHRSLRVNGVVLS